MPNDRWEQEWPAEQINQLNAILAPHGVHITFDEPMTFTYPSGHCIACLHRHAVLHTPTTHTCEAKRGQPWRREDA